MSKLKVKSETNITEVFKKAKKINNERYMQQEEINNCSCMKEKSPLPKNFYIYRPPYKQHHDKKKYPVCDHANDVTANRDLWTHEEYLKFLATPKKPHQPPAPKEKLIRRNISQATIHVEKLARPRSTTLIETFKAHSRHLPIFQVESLTKKICDNKFPTPQQAMSEMIQRLREKEQKVKRQRNEIKKLQNKIKRCNRFNTLTENITKTFREFMIKSHHRVDKDQCEEIERISVAIYKRLSHMLKGPRGGNKNNADVIDKVLLEFSDKFASCICDIIQNTQNDQQKQQQIASDECLKKFKNLYLPIEGGYPSDLVLEIDDSEIESDEDGKDNDSLKSKQEKTDDKEKEEAEIVDNIQDKPLSFLRLSQLNFTPEECAKLNEELRKVEDAINTGTLKKSASKKSHKSAKSVRSVDEDDGPSGSGAKKKKPKKKKKKAKKINLKCLGNLNPKPQWAVEWSSKSVVGKNDDEESS